MPKPSLPLFGSEQPPVASTDATRGQRALRRRHLESGVGSLDSRDPMPSQQAHACVRRRTQQGVQHIARASAVGKQFAVGFFVQVDAEIFEKRDGVRDVECAQDPADDRRTAAPKSRSDTSRLVTLQRVPPLTRIFAPGVRAPSSRAIDC